MSSVVIDVGESVSARPSRVARPKMSRAVMFILVALMGTSFFTVMWLFYEVQTNHDSSVLRFGEGDIEEVAFAQRHNIQHRPRHNRQHPQQQQSAVGEAAALKNDAKSTLSADVDESRVGGGGGGGKSRPSRRVPHTVFAPKPKITTTIITTILANNNFGPIDIATTANNFWSKETAALSNEPSPRREAVRDAMLHAWNGYVRCAWGHDELLPVSCSSTDSFGLGLTIVDSLSTLYVMNLTEQFNAGRDWIRDKFDPTPNRDVSVFETTIRVLGGLLSAYDLSSDPVFLKRAQILGDVLIKAFDGNSHMPQPYINLKTGYTSAPNWHAGRLILSEVGTLQMEFLHLSYHTQDRKYADIALLAVASILRTNPTNVPKGLYPNFYSMGAPSAPSGGSIAMGALGDSFYEYLLKVWLLGSRRSNVLRSSYEACSNAILNNMIYTTSNGLIFLTELEGYSKTGRMDHLACFSSGMLAMGAYTQPNASSSTIDFQETIRISKGIARTCMAMYRLQPTKLAPESINYRADGAFDSAGNSRYYLSRPETAESLMYHYRFSGEQEYRDSAYEIFEAIVKHTKTNHGFRFFVYIAFSHFPLLPFYQFLIHKFTEFTKFSGVRDVQQVPPSLDDLMQSFLLAETFKYLYLIFSPADVLPLDQFVFNTEAHPLRILKPNPLLDSIFEKFEKAALGTN